MHFYNSSSEIKTIARKMVSLALLSVIPLFFIDIIKIEVYYNGNDI